MTDEYELVHIAIAPPDTIEAGLIDKMAAIVKKDLYDTRLLLAGEIPRIIAHCHSMNMAESIAQELRDLGLLTIICRDSEFRKPLQIFRAYTMELGEAEVLFRDKGGRERRMGARDVFLILKGRMQTYKEEEKTNTRMKFSLPATMLTGGIPIWRRIREKTKDVSLQYKLFARLYGRKFSDSCVEIVQNQMNYSFLCPEITLSSISNFNTVITKLHDVFPQAVFDDRLTRFLAADISTPRAQDDIEIKLKLIHLCHLATSGLNPPL